MRSKTIDKYAVASYNNYNNKDNKFVGIQRKGDSHLGKKKKKRQKEKELLELKLLKTQRYESLAAIVGTIVTMLLAIITAVLSWFSK